MRADRLKRPPHRPALKLPTSVHQTDRQGKEFAEIVEQMLGKAGILHGAWWNGVGLCWGATQQGI